MSNNIEVNYHTTGESTVTNKLGMRQMQERVYAKRNSKYLLEFRFAYTLSCI